MPAVPQAAGAANGYGDLVTKPDFWRSIRLERRCNLDVPARMLLNGDFTLCPIRNFKGLNRQGWHARGGMRDNFCATSFTTSFGPQHKGS